MTMTSQQPSEAELAAHRELGPSASGTHFEFDNDEDAAKGHGHVVFGRVGEKIADGIEKMFTPRTEAQ